MDILLTNNPINTIISNYDYEAEYNCTDNIACKHFTKLMYLVKNKIHLRTGYLRQYFIDYINKNVE